MSKTPKNHRQEWTPGQDQEFRTLVRHNTPTRVMALKLDRTVPAVRNHARELGVSLKPTNQRPYGTRRG